MRAMADTRKSPIATVHQRVTHAFMAHWKKHANKYPKLIRLPGDQARQLDKMNSMRTTGEMWGVPVEIDETTRGEMIGIDGEVIDLATIELP